LRDGFTRNLATAKFSSGKTTGPTGAFFEPAADYLLLRLRVLPQNFPHKLSR
jgi:hypothetical protein